MTATTEMTDTSTFYVAALDERGNAIGLYVEALGLDEAWGTAESRKGVASVQAVQLIFEPKRN
jgi:hypothetical protein